VIVSIYGLFEGNPNKFNLEGKLYLWQKRSYEAGIAVVCEDQCITGV
jgi:hypothetical protein